jgi:outer membrane protein TolC
MSFPYLPRLLGAASALAVTIPGGFAQSTPEAAISGPAASLSRTATLEECLQTAMQSNRTRPVSRFAVAMAEAQHRQALSGYWPQISAKGAFMRMDESANFIFPPGRMYVPGQTVTVPAGTALVSVPAQLLNPSAPPGATIQLPVATPAQTINTAASQFPIPAQDIKLLDRDSVMASLNAVWLLYDGGMRKGYGEQAQGLVDMMKQEVRRTDLELVDTIKRYYYGSVLARQLHQLGRDTLARMEATLSLTETMYKEGGGKVKKTDWLDNKVMVESLRGMVALIEKNEAMAQAALANAMGLPWSASVAPADKEMPFAPFTENLDGLVTSAYQFNPDWGKVEAGLRAAEGAVRTANSGHHPKVALTGGLQKWWNDYDAGMATERNKEGWTVGVGVEIPLFNGFLTRGKVAETRARVAKIKEQQFLLKDGIGLQIKDTVLGLTATQKAHQATLDAMQAAVENRDLNTRAYQNDLVETEKVIRAQLMEALMSAQHYKARYDHIALRSQLNLIVGTEVLKKLEGK